MRRRLARRRLVGGNALRSSHACLVHADRAGPRSEFTATTGSAQMLIVEGDFYIQNFEGHPSWPASAQREKQSPLRDVASMVRSFSYAAQAALLKHPREGPPRWARLARWAQAWETWAAAAFLKSAIFATAAPSPTLSRVRQPRSLLGFFMIDRAWRELDGELNNRPDWIGIPLGGLLDLLEVR